MAGLCGFVNFEGEPASGEVLRQMAAISACRGPDGISFWHHGEAALCHLTLHATAESLTEKQPVCDPGGAVWGVADARLDNRQELIDLLSPHLLPYKESSGDASLILAAFLRWGETCVEHLLGDFAFVAWDARHRRLFAARDPLGIKPLCYARTGSLFCFASDAQQVLQHPSIPRRLDEATVGDFLAGNLGDRTRTFFLDIQRLPPAHWVSVTRAGVQLTRYWDIDPGHRLTYRRNDEYAAHLRELLDRAVTDRLRTRGNAIAIAMSGGLDSTSVAAMARRRIGTGSPRLLACSLFFESIKEADEREIIRGLAEALDLDLLPVEAERFWPLGETDSYPPSLESPSLGWESAFREMFSAAHGRGARVLLTGHGGDNLLGGSTRSYADRLRHGDLRVLAEVLRYSLSLRPEKAWWRALYFYLGEPLLPPAVDRSLRRLARKPTIPILRFPTWIDPRFARRTRLAERLAGSNTPRRFPDRSQQEIYENALHPAGGDQVLSWYDRASARFGLEARHPFLDRRLSEFVVSLPPQVLFELGGYKRLLRQAVTGILPEPFRQKRPKARLGGFLDLALREKATAQIEELVAEPLGAELGILDGAALQAAYWRYRQHEPQDGDRALWYALMFEMWLRHHSAMLGMERPVRLPGRDQRMLAVTG